MQSEILKVATVLLFISMSFAQDCGTGWQQGLGSVYCYRFEQTAKTWDDARSACQSFGGDLTGVADAGEMYFISTKTQGATKRYWIGLVDYVTEGVWGWSDASCADYTNWNTGEPNYNHGGRECAAVTTFSEGQNRWADDPCDSQYPFICRKKRVGQGQNTTNSQCEQACRNAFSDYVGYVYENNECRCLKKEFIDNTTAYVKCAIVELPTTTQEATAEPTTTTAQPTTTTPQPTTTTAAATTNAPTTQHRRAKCKKQG